MIKTIYIQATPSKVWDFLTKQEKLVLWFHPVSNDLEEGSSFKFYEKADTEKVCIWGKVIESIKPSKLKYTFQIMPFGDKESIVTWNLEKVMEGTKVTISHEGVEEAAGDSALSMLSALDKGWDQHLSKFRTQFEV